MSARAIAFFCRRARRLALAMTLALLPASAAPMDAFDRAVDAGEQTALYSQAEKLTGTERILAEAEAELLNGNRDACWAKLEDLDPIHLEPALVPRLLRLRGQSQRRWNRGDSAGKNFREALRLAAKDSRERSLLLLEVYRLALDDKAADASRYLDELALIPGAGEVAARALMERADHQAGQDPERIVLLRNLERMARAENRPGAALDFGNSLARLLERAGRREEAVDLAREGLREAAQRGESQRVLSAFQSLRSASLGKEPDQQASERLADRLPAGEGRVRFLLGLVEVFPEEALLEQSLREARSLAATNPVYTIIGLDAQARASLRADPSRSLRLSQESLALAGRDLPADGPAFSERRALLIKIYDTMIAAASGLGKLDLAIDLAARQDAVATEIGAGFRNLRGYRLILESSVLTLETSRTREILRLALDLYERVVVRNENAAASLSWILTPLTDGSLELLADPEALQVPDPFGARPLSDQLLRSTLLDGARLEQSLERFLAVDVSSFGSITTQAAIFNAKALFLDRLGRAAEAFAVVEQGRQTMASSNHPDRSLALGDLDRGRALLEAHRGAYGRAKKRLATLVDLPQTADSRIPSVRFHLGWLEKLDGFPEAALTVLQSTETPSLAEYLATIALLQELGRDEQALALLRAIRQDKSRRDGFLENDFKAEVLLRRAQRSEAMLLAKQGRFEESESLFANLDEPRSAVDPLFRSTLLWQWSIARYLAGKDGGPLLARGLQEYEEARVTLPTELYVSGSPLLGFENRLGMSALEHGMELSSARARADAAAPVRANAPLAVGEFVERYSRLRALYPELDAVSKLNLGSLNRVVASVPDDTLLIHLLPLRDGVARIAITGEGVLLDEVQVSPGILRGHAAKLASGATNTRSLGRESRLLYQALLSDLLERYPKRTKLRFLDSAQPWYLPWETLLDRNAKPLSDSRQVAYLDTLRAAGRAPVTPLERNVVIAGGNDAGLPGATREVAALRALLPKAIVTDPDRPIKEQLSRLLLGASTLHIAGHGKSDPRRFDRSYLLFGSQELPLTDILELPLQPGTLVVLAACETSGVEGQPALLSLASAFMSAGAGTTVGTLWPIDDRATQLFFGAFYEELVRSSDVDKSLDFARRALRAMPEYESPYFWGAFVRYGNL